MAYVISIVLIGFSALFSGLTLGLMGLDVHEVKKEGATGRQTSGESSKGTEEGQPTSNHPPTRKCRSQRGARYLSWDNRSRGSSRTRCNSIDLPVRRDHSTGGDFTIRTIVRRTDRLDSEDYNDHSLPNLRTNCMGAR